MRERALVRAIVLDNGRIRMYCYSVRRLADYAPTRYYYANGERMARYEFIRTAVHTPYFSRMQTRRDGSVIVREFHAYGLGG